MNSATLKQIELVKTGVDPAVVSQNPEIKSGAPVFPGTRVPVRFLLDYLETGRALGVFLSDFPTVKKEQAVNVLETAFERAIGPRDDEDPIR